MFSALPLHVGNPLASAPRAPKAPAPRRHSPPPPTSGRASQAGAHRVVARLSVQVSLCSACHRPVVLLSSEAPFLSWLISPPVRGLPRVQGPFLFFSSLPGVQDPSCFFFFFSFILPGYIGDLDCPFRCLRSSAGVQQVFCENCFTCRFFFWSHRMA